MAEHDSIDRHIAYWAPGLPALDPQLEGVVTRMQMLVKHLGRRKEAALAAQGLKQWEYEILWWLRAAGEPYRLTPTTLAEALDTHPATLTNRLDRLERDGYVTRAHDTADRRRLLVALTDKGLRAWESAIEEQGRAEERLLAPLSGAERDTLTDLLRRVVLAAEADGPPLMTVPQS
jgi:DNA-binding MarR family transcriptional regulator